MDDRFLKLVVRRVIMRNNQQHKRVVNKKYFRVHYSGAYALWQLSFGQVGYGELVILLGCIDRLVNGVYYKRVVPKTETWNNDDIAY